MSSFKDSEFMPASEKDKVLKAWVRFLKSGCKHGNFTERLYDHLIQHCSFIAHYSRNGFYQTYFEDPGDALKFLKQFDRRQGSRSVEYGWTLWLDDEYSDINNAMVEALEPYKRQLYKALHEAAIARTATTLYAVKAHLDELKAIEA